MNLWGPIGVGWFELRRSFSVGRIGLWLLMALFPAVLAYLIQERAGGAASDEEFVVMLFFLIVRVSCVMGLLLWATPVVNEEIEGRTWIYVASRPSGSSAMVLGKYAVALLWSISAGLVATVAAVIASGVDRALAATTTIATLVVLGSVAYGALFTFIGSLVQRRAMVVAIIYVVLIEGVLSLLPATINRFTVGYRLLSLLGEWMGYSGTTESERLELLYGEAQGWVHILILALYSCILVGCAVGRARLGGYLTDPED